MAAQHGRLRCLPRPTAVPHLCQLRVEQYGLVVGRHALPVLPQLVVRSAQQQQQVGAARVARRVQLRQDQGPLGHSAMQASSAD